MEITQSKVSSRSGPLIAVIKIEISDHKADRIFLHQNDDDMYLAQQFVKKHSLKSTHVQYIYKKIQISRASLVQQRVKQLQHETSNNMLFENSLQNRSNSQKTSYQYSNSSQNHSPIGDPQAFRKTKIKEVQEFYPTGSVVTQKDNYYRKPTDKYIRPYQIVKQQQQEQNQLEKSNRIVKKNRQLEGGQIFRQNNISNNQMQNFVSRQSLEDWKKPHNSYQYGVIQYHSGETSSQNQNALFDISKNKTKEQKSQYLFGNQLKNSNKNQYQQPIKNIVSSKKPGKISMNGVMEGAETRSNIFKKKDQALRQLQLHQVNSNSDYTFEDNQKDNRPSRVKILTKQQINQLKSSMRRSLSKTQISRINKEVTNRLYNQSQIKKNYLNKIRQKAKQDKQDKQVLQCTYSPQLNIISATLANQKNKVTNKPTYERLLESGRKAELKRENSRNHLANKQLIGCSFRPQLNQISQKLAKGRSFTMLAQPKISQNIQYRDDSMHRPKINKVSQQIVRTKGNFDQRLKAFLQKKNQKLHQKNKLRMAQQKIDKESGQPFFHPKVQKNKNGTTNMNRSRESNQNVCQYLYNLSKVPKQTPIEDHNVKINQKSQNLVERMYEKRLNWLFSELDNDHDGIISPHKISINSLSDDLFQIILPVLQQMEQMNIQLNLADFKIAIYNLHPSLNTLQKSILYDYKKKK